MTWYVPTSGWNRWFRFTAIVSVCAAGLISQGCGKKAAVDPWPENALAQVGDEFITKDDLEKESAYRASLGRDVPSDADLLNEMVEHKALLNQAQRDGVASEYETARTVDNLVITKWKDKVFREVEGSVTVTDDEIAQFYRDEVERYTQKAKVRLSLLRLKVPMTASDETRQQALQKMVTARDTALQSPSEPSKRKASVRGFGAVAADYSDEATSRYRGGDIGWLEVDNFDYRWPKSVLETGFRLQVGEVSGVLNLEDGVYLVRKTDERPGQITPLEDLQESIRKTLETKKLHELRQAAVQAAIKESGVRFPDTPAASGYAATGNVSKVHPEQGS